MNRFGSIGDKVPARGSAFASFWKERLTKESPLVQTAINNNLEGPTARCFKRSCMRDFAILKKENKNVKKPSYTMRLLMAMK